LNLENGNYGVDIIPYDFCMGTGQDRLGALELYDILKLTEVSARACCRAVHTCSIRLRRHENHIMIFNQEIMFSINYAFMVLLVGSGQCLLDAFFPGASKLDHSSKAVGSPSFIFPCTPPKTFLSRRYFSGQSST
jgi:hypothetical protein